MFLGIIFLNSAYLSPMEKGSMYYFVLQYFIAHSIKKKYFLTSES